MKKSCKIVEFWRFDVVKHVRMEKDGDRSLEDKPTTLALRLFSSLD